MGKGEKGGGVELKKESGREMGRKRKEGMMQTFT